MAPHDHIRSREEFEKQHEQTKDIEESDDTKSVSTYSYEPSKKKIKLLIPYGLEHLCEPEDNNSDQLVTIILGDFRIPYDYSDKLNEKLRVPIRKGYSGRYELINTIAVYGPEKGDKLDSPCDVKVSINSNVFIVSNYNKKEIIIFYLDTKKFCCKLKVSASPGFLVVEKNYKPKKDALIYACDDDCIYKYDLDLLIESCKKSVDPTWIWRLGTPFVPGDDVTKGSETFNDVSGLAIEYTKSDGFYCERYFNPNKISEENLLYATDSKNGCIKVFTTETGNFLTRFGVSGKTVQPKQTDIVFLYPWGLDIGENGEIVVGEYRGQKVQIIQRTGLTFESKFSIRDYFSNPNGITFVKRNRSIIVSDSAHNRTKEFSLISKNEEILVSEHYFGDNATPYLYGNCLNEKNGELYVIDETNESLLIFK